MSASGENAIRLQRARFIHSTTRHLTVVCGWCARAQGVHCSFSTIPPPSLRSLTPGTRSGSPDLEAARHHRRGRSRARALATLVLYVPNGTDKQPQRRARASRRAPCNRAERRARSGAGHRWETSSPRLTSYLLPASTAVQHPRPSRAGHASVRIGLALSAARSAHRRILAGTGPLCRASFPRPAPCPIFGALCTEPSSCAVGVPGRVMWSLVVLRDAAFGSAQICRLSSQNRGIAGGSHEHQANR